MKAYRVILTADTRGQRVEYKEFQGRKWFFGKPDPTKSYIGTFDLYDLTLQTNRKQKVFFKVVAVGKKNISIEVV